MGADAYTGHTKMRKAGIEVAKKGALPILEQYNAQAARYHNEYIPGFQDVCVYSEQERFGKYRDNHLTKQIVVAESDYIVQNFRESAESFVGLGKKTVIILGQHTNMCLMAVFLYCREVGLDLIFVRDLMDSCYVYELQKNHVKNHTAANVVVNKYIEKNFGSSVISYDLIRSIHKLDVEKVKPEYKMFANRAHIFKYIN
ncbi:isochorismatase family protein [Histomonas meleagridis]|uniref:isochorismatase family protein n=1 Tax=Histomonas meleagridis TaxID=135588 RepID=UPI00355AC4C1|nr:isochorismatase family protein [Histomonas meleagridis]KAH0797846.1 isochorismatase family protein [Histomonas meleagridis]